MNHFIGFNKFFCNLQTRILALSTQAMALVENVKNIKTEL